MQVSTQDCLYLQGVSFVVSFGWNIIVFFLSISPHDGHSQHVIRHRQLIFTYALKVKHTELILGRQVKASIYSIDSMACTADAIIFGFFSGERSQKRDLRWTWDTHDGLGAPVARVSRSTPKIAKT